MLVPMVRPLDDRVLQLAVVAPLVTDVIELGTGAFGTWILHALSVLPFDGLDFQNVIGPSIETNAVDAPVVLGYTNWPHHL